MSLIRRALNGTIGPGLPTAIAAAPGTVLHTFDSTGSGLGGPFPQRLTLTVYNPTNGALTVTLQCGDGTSIAKSLDSEETWKPFDSQPMQTKTVGTLLATGSGAGLVAWGFVETQT